MSCKGVYFAVDPVLNCVFFNYQTIWSHIKGKFICILYFCVCKSGGFQGGGGIVLVNAHYDSVTRLELKCDIQSFVKYGEEVYGYVYLYAYILEGYI